MAATAGTPAGVGVVVLTLVSLLDLPSWAKWAAGAAATLLGIYWLWLVLHPRIGLRWPLFRKKVEVVDPEVQQRVDTVRNLKKTVMAFFHSWAQPAMQSAIKVATDTGRTSWYRRRIRVSAWPMMLTATASGTPAARSQLAAPCRRPWNVTPSNPESVAIRSQPFENAAGDRWSPSRYRSPGCRSQHPCRTRSRSA